MLPAYKTGAPVCVVLYNLIMEAAQLGIAAQFVQGSAFYLLCAGCCHIISGPHFPQGLLLVIQAVQYIGFPVGQLCKGFFQGAVQLFLE